MVDHLPAIVSTDGRERQSASGYDDGAYTWHTAARSTYDDYGRPIDVYDGNDNHTATEYTSSIGLTTAAKVTNPLGQSTTTTLNTRRGLTLTSTDPNQVVTTSQFDAELAQGKLFVAAGMPTVGFSTAIGPHNYHDMRSIIDLAVDRGCTAISLMQHRATMRQTKDRFDYRQICAAAYELILRYREKIDVYTHDPFMLTLLDDRLDGGAARADYIGTNLCNVGTSMVSIDPTGAVLACNFLPTGYGSVLKEPFAEIWARLVHLTGGIDHGRHGACGSCELANLCGGGCLAHREASHS